MGKLVLLFGLVCVTSLFGTSNTWADLIICGNMRAGCADTGRYTVAAKPSYYSGKPTTTMAAYLNLAKAIGNTNAQSQKHRQQGNLQSLPKNKNASLVIPFLKSSAVR